MWWLIRLGFIVGGTVFAGELLSGCSRRRDERPLIDHSGSAQPVPPSFTPPQLPSVGSASGPSSSSTTTASSASAFIDCSRFQSPVFTANVSNPAQELRIFRESVLPILNRYTPQLDQNDFSGVFQDRELTASLLTLQGAGAYLREGNPVALDTESDLTNIYTAFYWLQNLESAATDPNPRDDVSRGIQDAWRRNILTVNFKGFYFQDYRIPHRDGRAIADPSSGRQSQPYNRFRIVNPMNVRDYPDFGLCRIPQDVVYSWARPTTP